MVIFSRINNNLYEVKFENTTIGCITKTDHGYNYKSINSNNMLFDTLDAARQYIESHIEDLFNYTKGSNFIRVPLF